MSKSERRRRAAIGNSRVIPAPAGIQFLANSERRRRAAIGCECRCALAGAHRFVRAGKPQGLPPIPASVPAPAGIHACKRQRRRFAGLGIASLAGLLAGSNAMAQSATPALSDGPSLLPLILAFALVLGLVPVALWVLKRFNSGLPAQATGLRIVGQLPLGAQQRIVIVEAGERWLLLGVTGASISRVGTLPKGAPTSEALQPASFGALLARFGGRDGQLPRS